MISIALLNVKRVWLPRRPIDTPLAVIIGVIPGYLFPKQLAPTGHTPPGGCCLLWPARERRPRHLSRCGAQNRPL